MEFDLVIKFIKSQLWSWISGNLSKIFKNACIFSPVFHSSIVVKVEAASKKMHFN